jgi:hypothetical protein
MKTKFYYLIPLLTLSTLVSFAQSNTWTSFWNADSTLIGYKDLNGAIKIEPKFESFMSAKKFDNVIVTVEKSYDKWNVGYLNKSGKTFGRDSIYLFDNAPDCESEGFIRFRDKSTHKVGMFNKHGKAVIPASYNDLTKVRNGLTVALVGAEKKYLDNDKHDRHYDWKGGRVVLLDTLNCILIDNFSYDDPLNFFTLEKTAVPHTDTIRKSFLAKDGSYYSFVDFKKEFKQWITKTLQRTLTSEKLIDASYDTIAYYSKGDWIKTTKEKLLTVNFAAIKKNLIKILQAETGFEVSYNGLNLYIFEGKGFEKYFDNCGEAKDWRYPTMSISSSNKNNRNMVQSHYKFLRTDEGYKLICIDLRNGIN